MADKNPEKINYHEHDDLPDMFPDFSNVASVNDTTGMMPTPPRDGAELHSYQDMAGMSIPKVAPGKESHPQPRKAGKNSISDYFNNRPQV